MLKPCMKPRDDKIVFVRHCVEASNVDGNSFVIDPSRIRHVALKAGKIEDMSGFVDPLTHLNLDFSDHKVDVCVISEQLKKGAKVRISNQGFAFAGVRRSCFKHLGFVDETQRLLTMKESIKAIREARKEGANSN
jgi:hypothetical protein